MFKISGLDGFSKTLEEAAKALEGVDGEVGSVSFDPNDPASIETAIAEIARLVDEKLGACLQLRDCSERWSHLVLGD